MDWKKIIGRASDCDIVFGDQMVSRHHAVLILRYGRVYIVDSNSTHGTFINGYKITPGKYYELRDDARVTLARMEFNWKKHTKDTEDRKPFPVGLSRLGNYSEIKSESESHPDRKKHYSSPIKDDIDKSSNDYNVNINYVGAHVNKNAENGADWKVPLKERIGSGVGSTVGSTLGCLLSIVIVIVFLFLVFGGIKACS